MTRKADATGAPKNGGCDWSAGIPACHAAKRCQTSPQSGPRIVCILRVEGAALTLKEVQALLEPHARPGVPPTFLWRRVQSYADVIHVPPGVRHGVAGASNRSLATRRPPDNVM